MAKMFSTLVCSWDPTPSPVPWRERRQAGELSTHHEARLQKREHATRSTPGVRHPTHSRVTRHSLREVLHTWIFLLFVT